MSEEKINLPPSEKLLWDIKETATVTGLAVTTVRRLVRQDEFPQPRTPRRVDRALWLREDVEAWSRGLPIRPSEDRAKYGGGSRHGGNNVGEVNSASPSHPQLPFPADEVEIEA